MFEHFFREYRISVYPHIKISPWAKQRVANVVFITTGAIGIIIAIIGQSLDSLPITIGGMCAFFPPMIFMSIWDRMYKKKHRKKLRLTYVNEKLSLLKNLLKDEEFNFYAPEKISYLIACCETELAQYKKTFLPDLGAFGKVLYTVTMMALGAFLDRVEPENAALIFANLLVLLPIVIALVVFVFMIKNDIEAPKRDALISFKNELEYIRAELKDEEASAEKEKLTEAQEGIVISIQ